MPLEELIITGGGEPMLGAGNAFDKINKAIESLNLLSSQNLIGINVVEIGDWNMDTTISVSVPHGITGTVVFACASIISDSGSTILSLDTAGSEDSDHTPSGYVGWGASNIDLFRLDARLFDSSNYNSTGFNRGHVLVVYLK